MIWDGTINLGHVLTVIGFVVTSLGIVYAIRSDVKQIEVREKVVTERLGTVERDLEKITEVLVVIARQDERMIAQGRRIDDLSERMSDVGGRVSALERYGIPRGIAET